MGPVFAVIRIPKWPTWRWYFLNSSNKHLYIILFLIFILYFHIQDQKYELTSL